VIKQGPSVSVTYAGNGTSPGTRRGGGAFAWRVAKHSTGPRVGKRDVALTDIKVTALVVWPASDVGTVERYGKRWRCSIFTAALVSGAPSARHKGQLKERLKNLALLAGWDRLGGSIQEPRRCLMSTPD